MSTPKERFQLTPHAKLLSAAVAADPSLEVACDYALLQLQSEMPRNCQPAPATDVMVGFDANAQMKNDAPSPDKTAAPHEDAQ